jgi:threonine/homoserine/homoserine lactone efflux protein
VLFQSIGAALPAALAIALSPFPVIGIVLILASPSGRRNGPLFAAGWVVGLTALAALVAAMFGAADNPDSTSSAIADWARVIAGAALIVLGARKWRRRPRPGDVEAPPGWMTKLDEATAGKAFVLGVLLSGINPKNFVLTASAATSMAETGIDGTDLLVAVLVFVLIASCTVLGAVVVHFVGGQWGASLLDAVRQFMVANSTPITVVILLILGAKVLGDGLIGLGR